VTATLEGLIHERGLPELTISDPVQALLDEVAGGNVVRVFKSEITRPNPRARSIHKAPVEIPSLETQAMLPGLFAHDTLRHLAGKKPIYAGEMLRLFGQQYLDAGFNLRTNVGADFTYNQLSGTSVAVADTMALSNNTGTPAATDTAATLPWSTAQSTAAAGSGTTGEWTALGLARKVATTNTHSAGATTYTLAATWTGATSATTGTRWVGLFGGSTKATAQSAAATNILCIENTFTNADLQVGDTLTVTWTITI
jgi:hypothetical protein